MSQQNAYVERYNLTVLHVWLAYYLFHSIEELQEIAARWVWTYNDDRPHMSIGGITPRKKLALAA
jgi:putative transposase